MMWNEFMELAGYEVSYETYSKVIEPLYMALPENITKQEFIKMLDKKAFALPTKKQMQNKMKKIANFLFENCGISSFHDEKEELRKLTHEYAERFYSLDWSNDISTYVYTTEGYAYRGCLMDRGCTFPHELVIGKGTTEYERLTLVKI